MSFLDIVKKLSRWNLTWPDEDIHKTGTGEYSGMENRFPTQELHQANVFGDGVEESRQLVKYDAEGHQVGVTPVAHRLVLDIDFPAVLIPSSTPGHHHLVVDRIIPHTQWENLMRALADAGVIEEGYANASIARGQAFIRAPWCPKPGAPVSYWWDTSVDPPILKPHPTALPEAPWETYRE